MSNLIFESLAEVNKSVSAIKKEKRNKQQGFNFRGIDDVMNELHGLFAKNGLIIVTEAQGEPVITQKETRNKSILFFTRQLWKFTFYAKDGSSVSSVVWGEAMDSGDKGMNKSISVSLKYALLTMFLIPTEDMIDPDSESHEISQDQKPNISPVAQYFEELRKTAPKFTTAQEFTDEKEKIITKFGFVNKELSDYLGKLYNENVLEVTE